MTEPFADVICRLSVCDGSGWLPTVDRQGNDAARPCACRAPAPQVAVGAKKEVMKQASGDFE